MSRIGRNDYCPCGSGKKYKKCCLAQDEARALRAAPMARVSPEEEPFTAEMRPDLDKQVDRLLARLERGERGGLGAEIEDLLEQHPGYHMTNYAMGVYVAMAENDPVGAIPFFEKVVRIFPLLAEGHFNLGSSYFKAARIAEAVAAFRKAIRYSDGADGIDELARDRLRELEEIVRKSYPFPTLEAFLENQKLFDQAFEQLREQHYEQAAALFEKVLEQYPDHVQSHGNLALAQAGLGQKAAALKSLDTALMLDPAYEPARANRKVIEHMHEGEPFIPGVFAETEFYREKLEAENPRPSRWRQLLEAWKS